MLRIGEGYDIHRLSPGGPLMLGCVEVAAEFGAVGHSDGDVLAHAVCDAIFGALGTGDIGQHFPPNDDRWAGVRSHVFLEAAAQELAEHGFRIVNLDCTVILERPKLAPVMGAIRSAIATAVGCDVSQVSVKAKTAEGLGAVGEGSALEARAVVLLESSR